MRNEQTKETQVSRTFSLPTSILYQLSKEAAANDISVSWMLTRVLATRYGMGSDAFDNNKRKQKQRVSDPIAERHAIIEAAVFDMPRDFLHLHETRERPDSFYTMLLVGGSKWSTGTEITEQEKQAIRTMKEHFSIRGS